jgi:hypothetical protein
MTYMALWLGGLTSSAFLYGVGWGLWIYPPVAWGVSPGTPPKVASGTGPAGRIAHA